MPHQNRVLPTGEIVAVAARGTLTGNRGVLHDAHGRIGRARWRHKAWICCTLDYKGRRREVMSPGRWTELFFLDEAVALAAGHRPCALCRRAAYDRFRKAFPDGPMPAAEMDRVLHRARLGAARAQLTHEAAIADLPDGTFIGCGATPWLVLGDRIFPYSPAGYGAPTARPSTGRATVLTPAPTVAALRNGYGPDIHPSAQAPQSSSTA